MRQKTFYRYNPATEQYERVYLSRSRRFWSVARHYVFGICLGAAGVVGLYYVTDFPRERLLRESADGVLAEVQDIDRRADEAIAVLEDIAARDNNFYRVVFQADPLPDASRYAGLERQRLYTSLDSMSDRSLVHSVESKLDRLERMIYAQSKSFDYLKKEASTFSDRLTHVPAIQPVSSEDLRTLSSGFGRRRDPVYGTSRFHEGMDFASDIGTPVYATGDAKVVWADWKSGYGNLVELDHGYNYITRYGHLSEIKVQPGQLVKRGDLIALVGNTGKSTGPHLHYEVRYKGEAQNPVNFYYMDLTPEEYYEMIRQAENAGHVMD